MLRARRITTAVATLIVATASAVGFGAGTASADLSPGAIGMGWSIPNVPAAGLSNITFPMEIDPQTLRKDGTYFAQQFGFTNLASGAYMGLQPRPDLNGHERLHAAFSSFIKGTTSSDPLCSNGADGGDGVSCKVEFDGVYGHVYNLTVARTDTDTWSGSAVDTATGVSTHLGSWSLPAGSGGLTGSFGGFVEWYLGAPSCDQISYISATFGNPTSTDAGGLHGKATANEEYGNCKGVSGYKATAVSSGAHVVRGSVANTPSGSPTTEAPTTSTAPASSSSSPSNSPRPSPSASRKPTATTPSRASKSATSSSTTTPSPTSPSSVGDSINPSTPESSPMATSGPPSPTQATSATSSGSLAPLAVTAGLTGTAGAAGGLWLVQRKRRLARSATRRGTGRR